MRLACAQAQRLADEIGARHRVRFELGAELVSEPAQLDPAGRERLKRLADEAGVAAVEMASGAGHDAAVFANFGVPANMIFIRNDNGSHNPDEAMSMADFGDAARLLAAFVMSEAA
jgi:N-carbamoyl-L-amino-acid hydrolase